MIVRPWSITMVKDWVVDCAGLPLSVTLTVNVLVPGAVGVPLITPVFVFKLNGSVRARNQSRLQSRKHAVKPDRGSSMKCLAARKESGSRLLFRDAARCGALAFQHKHSRRGTVVNSAVE